MRGTISSIVTELSLVTDQLMLLRILGAVATS